MTLGMGMGVERGGFTANEYGLVLRDQRNNVDWKSVIFKDLIII